MAVIRVATQEETFRFRQKRKGLIRDVVVEEQGEVIGYGALMHFVEAQMEVLGTHRNRVEALRLLMGEAIGESVRRQVAELHVATSDVDFARVLQRRFGFKSDNEIPLTLDLE